ncbi:hypothetical protein LMG3410_00750 [Achromobacter aegrifaciens]|nr:hypothetical protein LMG3410_00750 [Achromobacter aegrifaciens]
MSADENQRQRYFGGMKAATAASIQTAFKPTITP